MNRKLDLPIPTRPSTPSNLWSTTPIENRLPSPAFNKKILPSHCSSNTRHDKENDGGLIKVEEDVGISNSESQVLPTDVTPPPGTAERTDPSINMSSGTVQERTQLSYLCQTS